jgi:hypothetical protein
MRPQRRTLFSFAALLAVTACGGFQQGYYGPCDEPAGLAAGCDPAPEEPAAFTAWDACVKLATCGVILPQTDPPNPEPGDATPFEACVDEIQKSQRDLGSLVLLCVEEATCPDLLGTIDENDDPNAGDGRVEGVIGWCGRLDPA